mgnify:CR=1 FL=1|tara:strand:+ start:509 stop:742 length:234 start_codon:yes stop_codon:yes gene_type:complete
MDFGLSTGYLIIIIIKAIKIARKINLLLLNNKKDFLLNVFRKEEDPHLEHTILPPKDRSETNLELPQLRHTLFKLIS